MLSAAALEERDNVRQSNPKLLSERKNRELPLKLLRSSFSALARFEVGSEPARALRLRDSIKSVSE